MIRDISLRYKIPIRSTILILITSLTVTAALIFRAYDDLKQDLLGNAENMGSILAQTLLPALIKDNVWHTFELISAPLDTKLDNQSFFRAESIIVLDNNLDIYVASDPFQFPMLTPLAKVNNTYLNLQHYLSSNKIKTTQVLDLSDTDSLYVVTPIISDNVSLGLLVLNYPRASFTPRFARFVSRALFATIIALSVLVPLSWYWGSRLAEPLVNLANCMTRIGQIEPARLQCKLYESKDEIGQLGARFKQMIDELKEKQELEKQIISAERLAAVGRLTASIGHEINNPLGGMINAINTYRRYGQLDEVTDKTTSLLERGLLQIKDTVSALLVEAKPSSRHFNINDINDIHTLIHSDLQKHNIRFELTTSIDTVPLPATLIRQILINLLLNAIKAVPDGGHIGCLITIENKFLVLIVNNNGDTIPHEQLSHLFEPFVHYQPDGNGLGLWVCYQIINQLDGTIKATSNEKETQFTTRIPLPL